MRKRIFFEEFDSLYYFYGASRNWEMRGLHFHRQYEIILFMSEGIGLEIGDRVYKVGKGDIFFINNKEYHGTVCNGSEEYRRYVLMFEPEILEQMSGAFGYNFGALFEEVQEDIVNWMHLSEEKLAVIEEKMGAIERGISRNMDNEHNKINLKLCLLDLLNTLSELYFSFSRTEVVPLEEYTKSETSHEEPVPYRDRIEQIKKYIVAHVDEKLELDDIAGHFYMNKYYLSHYFKKETGFTLSQYITNQKIAAAKKRLKSGMSVTEVALSLSYNRDSHFISVFKKMTGITPKKYAQGKDSKNA